MTHQSPTFPTNGSFRFSFASPTSRWWLLVLMILVGAMLRLAFLGSKSLWFDEAFTVLLSERTLPEIWQFPDSPGDDPHPRLFKTFLHYWIGAMGRSEFSVRLPTAYASILNMALLGLLARRLFNHSTALLAVALLALAPLEIWYAQETRMYMIVTTMGLIFAVMLTVNHWLALPGLLAALTIGLYVDIPMVPLSLGLSVIWLVQWWQQGRDRRRLFIWGAAVVGSWLLFLPISTYLTFTLDDLNRIFVIREIRNALGLPIFAAWHYIVALLVVALLLGGGTLFLQHQLRRPDFRRWFGPLVVVVFGVITLTIPIPRLYALERVILTGWPYIVLLVAWLLMMDNSLRRRTFLPLLGVSMIASLGALAVPKDDWRGAVAFIENNAHSGDLVWIEPSWNRNAVEYYQLSHETRSGTLTTLEQVATRDLWIIAERSPNLPVPSSPGEAWLDANLHLVSSKPFYRLEVRHYRP
jgi:uncharacterized membrane protein